MYFKYLLNSRCNVHTMGLLTYLGIHFLASMDVTTVHALYLEK